MTNSAPGIYWEEIAPATDLTLKSGVPAFLGVIDHQGGGPAVRMFTRWSQFQTVFGMPSSGVLSYAVRGFFENGGHLCYVLPLQEISYKNLQDGLTALAAVDEVDLICAPDVTYLLQSATGVREENSQENLHTLQRAILDHCETLGDRMAILDTAVDANPDTVLQQRHGLYATNGALYFPWIKVKQGPQHTMGFIPPCGHVAGIYARMDKRVGIHKAAANEPLEGVLDVKMNINRKLQGRFNAAGVNSLVSFPGRGIRVWGARTLSDNPAWRYINVRRLFLQIGRWLERNLQAAVFEPNDGRLWARIERETTAYLEDLFDRGAFRGVVPEQAFYVKCDAENNPPAVRDAGQVVSEIGVAANVPNEFIVLRVVQSANGIHVENLSHSGLAQNQDLGRL